MKTKTATVWIFSALILGSCGGGSSSSDSSTSDASSGFPTGTSVSSPLSTSSSSTAVASLDAWRNKSWLEKTQIASVLMRRGEWTTLAHVLPGNPFITDAYAASGSSEHEGFLTLLSDILFGRVPLAMALTQAFLFEAQAPDADCYGPSMNYVDHPNGPTPNNGQLPGGDLGIWLDTVNGDTTACAAAQLNAKMRAAKRRVHTALLMLAGMRYQAFRNSLTPTAGSSASLVTQMNSLGISGVTFTTATLARSSDGATWTYNLAFTVTLTGPSPGPYPVTVTLSNTEVSAGNHSGILQFTAENVINFGNCPASSGTSRTVTQVSTVKYDRSSTSANVNQRAGTFCGSASNLPTNVYTTDSQVNPSAKYDNSSGKGWGDNFSRFTASYNPSTLDGNFVYAWQAGKDDNNSRIFNVWTQTSSGTRSGEAYFGFGDDISTSNGAINGMICNWAGPGNSHAYLDYAQRQSLAFDDSSGKWLTGSSGSDIRYAPTTNCQYTNAQRTGGATFWYDRDLTGATSGAASQANLIVDPSDVSFPLDLMDKGASATIAEAIAARGFSLPSSF